MRRFLGSLAALSLLSAVAGCDRGAKDAPADESTLVAAVGAEWRVETSVGADGQLMAEVVPGAGYDINLEYPWKLTVGDAVQGMDDAVVFDAKRARFAVPSSSAAAPINGELRFSVCNDKTCLTPRETLVWSAE